MVKGRPRHQAVERYPSGQIKPENARLLALVANARIDMLNNLNLGNVELSTELGRLHIQGRIGDVQKRAGDEWVDLVDSHRRIVLDGLSGRPVMGAMERRSRSSGVREYAADTIRKIADKFNKVKNSILILKHGQNIMNAVDHLCIEDRMLFLTLLNLSAIFLMVSAAYSLTPELLERLSIAPITGLPDSPSSTILR